MDLRSAVHILATDQKASYAFEREFAVATFAAWLNWPMWPNAIAAFQVCAVNRAVAHCRGQGQPLHSEWLYRVYDPGEIPAKLGSGLCAPFYDELRANTTYNDYRYVADIVRFLLTFKAHRTEDEWTDKRKEASLGKAAVFLNKFGGFVDYKYGPGAGLDNRDDWCSLTRHQTVWREFKRSAALQFVRFYDSKIDWLFDPVDDDLLDRLTAIANSTTELTAFFCKALDIQLRLKAILDARSLDGIDFSFPESLRPVECFIPKAPKSKYSQMTLYKKSSNIKNPIFDV